MKKITSKFLSLILRHKPDIIGLTLDQNGWADVRSLITACAKHDKYADLAILKNIVSNCPKQRFAFNDDISMIRANQGHSILVDLNLAEMTPPNILYHGTHTKVINDIFRSGIKKMGRHHVHLSANYSIAVSVGSRRGNPVVFEVNSKLMHDRNIKFFLSTNSVWLVDYVPTWAIIRTFDDRGNYVDHSR